MSFVNSSLPRTAAHPPQFSPREFRDALGMFATGVAIVTARSENGQPLGMTINSFNSVSLEPPLVLWSLAQRSSLLQALTLTRHCAIHVLTAAQRPLAERFATRGIDRWAGVAHHPGLDGTPLIEGAAATFECFSRSQYPEGDHVIFVGEVERCSHRAGVRPLLYHGGHFHTQHSL